MKKVCPRAKSDMTPCAIKDGELAIGCNSDATQFMCVGCDVSIDVLGITVTEAFKQQCRDYVAPKKRRR
jgi:hypothetical protein